MRVLNDSGEIFSVYRILAFWDVAGRVMTGGAVNSHGMSLLDSRRKGRRERGGTLVGWKLGKEESRWKRSRG